MEYGDYTPAEKEIMRLGGETARSNEWEFAHFFNRLAASLFINWMEQENPGRYRHNDISSIIRDGKEEYNITYR